MKRIIISGGGTGGHIYPAITIYKEIMKQNPDAQVLYVGTERGLEATLVPKEGIEFTTLPVQIIFWYVGDVRQDCFFSCES